NRDLSTSPLGYAQDDIVAMRQKTRKVAGFHLSAFKPIAPLSLVETRPSGNGLQVFARKP
ncbi:MAG: hypothetical protein IJU84_00805, partial [Clostridia bacterium]|nr:hypothetical protein [Clostridia bacterium]